MIVKEVRKIGITTFTNYYSGIILVSAETCETKHMKFSDSDCDDEDVDIYQGTECNNTPSIAIPATSLLTNLCFLHLIMTIFIITESSSEGKVSLKKILAFFTGGDSIPPAGFHKECTLNFNPSNPYPTASTCALVLTLPTRWATYEDFKTHADVAFTMHGGFGLI